MKHRAFYKKKKLITTGMNTVYMHNSWKNQWNKITGNPIFNWLHFDELKFNSLISKEFRKFKKD